MKLILSLATVLGLMLVTGTVSAHTTPEDLAARSVAKLDQVVDRCENAAADETAECLHQIRRLLADGQEQAARRVASNCIESATERAEKCAKYIKRLCHECIEQLVSLGATQLARRVNQVCEDAISDIRLILQREKNAIQNAFDS
ncbi:hypothetical protein [Gimesia algae]|uniref:Uncharacterized protein n=1 Tax=Gimesia algae TaxID=2527971 RepID=A0A517VI83_9PLAN|nr:hypothetical protein [Gimesia algae]QDT92720.1 hypothetical protein Pan161_43900 [Gimesia algae]